MLSYPESAGSAKCSLSGDQELTVSGSEGTACTVLVKKQAGTDRAIGLQALSASMVVCHEVLRAQLNKYKGVEMQADGDAVLLGFRDPISAVAWALATQQVQDLLHLTDPG